MRNKISNEKLEEAVKNSFSIYGVLEYLGIKKAGGSHSHYKLKILKLGLDVSHFKNTPNKGKISKSRKKPDEILILRTEGGREKHHKLKRALIETGVEYKCSKCNQPPIWFGNNLTLDVDHINENWLDDRKENLRFLCPNCHSQFSRKLMGD